MTNDTTKQFPQMDWQQVVLNGGPPCFFVEGPEYCGRAERWQGHGNAEFHDYVSLEQLLNATVDSDSRAVSQPDDDQGEMQQTAPCFSTVVTDRDNALSAAAWELLDALDSANADESVAQMSSYINIENAKLNVNKLLGRMIYCHGCSEAGGADRSIYHKPPVCASNPATQATESSEASHNPDRGSIARDDPKSSSNNAVPHEPESATGCEWCDAPESYLPSPNETGSDGIERWVHRGRDNDAQICTNYHVNEPESSTSPDHHVAWCRYRVGSIEICNSDAEGAFKIYRSPEKNESIESCRNKGVSRDCML